jgi:UrcA family protein
MNSLRAAIMTTVAAFGVTVSAVALADRDTPTLTVKYDDLNVESEQGATALYARLRMASRHVCANFEGRELRHRAAWKECYVLNRSQFEIFRSKKIAPPMRLAGR